MPLELAYFYDIPLPNRWAAGIQILRTARALADIGLRATVFTGPIQGDDIPRCLAHYGLTPHPNLILQGFFPASRTSWDQKAALKQYLTGRPGSQVVMSRGETGIGLYPDLPRDTRFVYEAHRLCWEYLQEQSRGGSPLTWPLRRWRIAQMRETERCAVEGARGLVCLNRFVRDALAESFDVSSLPTLILPSGTDCYVPDGRDPLSDSSRDIDILYVGKFQDRKGVRLLVEALARLGQYSLWLVGGKDQQRNEIRDFARSLGIPDERLHLPGYIEPARVRELFLRARVGVCPLPAGESRVSEAFTSPMKILEMMASGTPIVATDLPSIREILQQDQTALLVRPNDPAALAEAVRRLLTDRPLADRLRARALQDVQAYSWESRARKLRDFLISVGSGERAA